MSQKSSTAKSSYWTAKRKLWLQNTVIVLIVVGVFGFFGYSVVSGLMDRHVETHYVDTQVISDYMDGVTNEEVTE